MSSGQAVTGDDVAWALRFLSRWGHVAFVIGLDGTVEWRRELVEGVTRVPDHLIVGSQIIDRSHPDDVPIALAMFDDLVAGRQQEADIVVRVRSVDPALGWMRNRVRAVRLPDGRVACLASILDDGVELDLTQPDNPGFSIADAAPVGLALLGIADLVVYANPAVRRLLGIVPGPLAGDDHTSKVVRTLTTEARRTGSHRIETAVEERSLVLRAHRIGATDRPEVVLVAQDVTDLRSLEAGKRQADQLFATAFEHAPSGIALVGLDGTLLRVNPAFAEITGYSVDELLELDFAAITHPDDLDADLANVQRLRRGQIRSYRMEKRYLHRAGHAVWVELRVSGAYDEVGTLTHFISQIADITTRRLVEEQQRATEADLTHRATHDLLTDLPNRALLDEHLRLLLARVRRETDSGAVLFCDLDGFKAVNDEFGHRIGDETLVEAGRRLRDALRESDLVARVGGDEFVVALSAADHPEGVASVAERLHGILTEPFHLAGATVRVGASIGVTAVTVGDDPGSAIHRADALAYEAKRSGGGVRHEH
ncbi:MAG: diguanylate cyclase domain-containing protein [Acidimicrobiales bacterium]